MVGNKWCSTWKFKPPTYQERNLLFGEKSAFGKGYLRPVMRLLGFYIFENAPSDKIVGEPDHTVKPYAAVVEEMCYEAQRLIPMPEKTAMLYYCQILQTEILFYKRKFNQQNMLKFLL